VNYTRISLMSHITKLLLRVIVDGARKAIRPEIGIEQYHFVNDAGMRNAVFVVKMIGEQMIRVQKPLYV